MHLVVELGFILVLQHVTRIKNQRASNILKFVATIRREKRRSLVGNNKDREDDVPPIF